jgi:hypothetical protein
MALIESEELLEKVQFRNPIDNHNAEVIAGCVNLTRRIIENSPVVDPVHYAGGVYCHECAHNLLGLGYCGAHGLRKVEPGGFCSDGQTKEDFA